jgi:hypothetical protein
MRRVPKLGWAARNKLLPVTTGRTECMRVNFFDGLKSVTPRVVRMPTDRNTLEALTGNLVSAGAHCPL